MKDKTMGRQAQESVRAKSTNSGRVHDATAKVRSIINGIQDAIKNTNKAVKGGCKGC